MAPILKKVDLSAMSEAQRNKICSCKGDKCSEGIAITTFNDGMILCKGDARKHFYSMTTLLGAHEGRASWTKKDEQEIIELVQQKGRYRGYIEEIAEKFGKTYQQAKDKTRVMRRKGLI